VIEVKTYLIVNDTDGCVEAEFTSIRDALRMLKTLPAPPAANLRLVVFDDTGGAITRTESWVTVRTL
jgi:hypothetical protein